MNEPRPPTAAARSTAEGRAVEAMDVGRWELTAEAFAGLLAALGDDRDEAGRRYVEIRERLVRLFAWRGCPAPEELADETINRVAHKLAGGVEIRAEDPFRYFCGVAYLVFKEVLRRDRRRRSALGEVRREVERQPPERFDLDDDDPRMDCLRACVGRLGDDERALILDYHRGEKGERIKNRKRIAARLGIPINALRIRVHRLKGRLESCVGACLEKKPERRNGSR